ncbi:hypothetical protein NNO_1238 [Hydrogenimonas sp.]|nr:hypothetical protein NNO_1238 [Hydrogenimonas sp.]
MQKISPCYKQSLDVLKSSRLFGGLRENELDDILPRCSCETYKNLFR